mgnify:CR=1 FL=1
MARFDDVMNDLEGLFGMFRAAWEKGTEMADEDRATASKRGEAIMKDIMEGLEQATALDHIFEEVGKAVRKVAAKSDSPEKFLKAGFDALEPKGDDDDDLRVGIQWFVIACSGGAEVDGDGEEDEEEERPKRKKPRWANRGRE